MLFPQSCFIRETLPLDRGRANSHFYVVMNDSIDANYDEYSPFSEEACEISILFWTLSMNKLHKCLNARNSSSKNKT